jgi:hypothetical protein
MNTKTLFAFILTLLVVTGFAGSSYAATDEEIENACMNKADEQNISEDKYEDFVSKCIADTKAGK